MKNLKNRYYWFLGPYGEISCFRYHRPSRSRSWGHRYLGVTCSCNVFPDKPVHTRLSHRTGLIGDHARDYRSFHWLGGPF